jgi:hypothetical protein
MAPNLLGPFSLVNLAHKNQFYKIKALKILPYCHFQTTCLHSAFILDLPTSPLPDCILFIFLAVCKCSGMTLEKKCMADKPKVLYFRISYLCIVIPTTLHK